MRVLRPVVQILRLTVLSAVQTNPAAQHVHGGFFRIFVVAQCATGEQSNHGLAQHMLMSTEHRPRTATARGLTGRLQFLTGQGVQGKLLHGPTVAPQSCTDGTHTSSEARVRGFQPNKARMPPEHGNRSRRVEYTIGWPLDERTVAGIKQLREHDWGAAVHSDGEVDPAAQVADLTGILRRGPDGDRLATWPADMRVIARRTPRPATKPAKLGEHPDWEYGAFVTNTPSGQVQFLDARHRTQAHVEG